MISSTYKAIRDQLDIDTEYDRSEIVEIMEAMRTEDDSFEVAGYLFVKDDHLDKYLAEYLTQDLYCLGCFTAWFVANELDIGVDVIEAMQEAEAFEAVGKLIESKCNMEEFASSAASADGYGHFLNPEDGNEYEINGYTVFAGY